MVPESPNLFLGGISVSRACWVLRPAKIEQENHGLCSLGEGNVSIVMGLWRKEREMAGEVQRLNLYRVAYHRLNM